LKETFGDGLEAISRAVANFVVIGIASVVAKAVAEVGAGVIAVTSIAVAQTYLAPFVSKISESGVAALEGVVASGISDSDYAAIVIGQAVPAMRCIAEVAKASYFAMQGQPPGDYSPFDIAKSGGKHHGFLENYKKKPMREIESGIKSLKKQILKHRDCIKNPTKYYPRFQELDPRHQKDLINIKWPKDIARQLEHLNILEELLKTVK
jgi:hypothetical protein